ncbi:hypothetical protein AOLI_G00066120 [Acnodon oligacanthus]
MPDSRDDSLNTSQTHPNTLIKKASTGLECFCCIQSRLSLDQRSSSQRFPEVMGTKPGRPSEFGPRQDVAMSVPVRSQRPVACLCQLGPGLAVPDLKQRSRSCATLTEALSLGFKADLPMNKEVDKNGAVFREEGEQL